MRMFIKEIFVFDQHLHIPPQAFGLNFDAASAAIYYLTNRISRNVKRAVPKNSKPNN